MQSSMMVVLLQAASLLMMIMVAMLSMSGAEANSGHLQYDFYRKSCKKDVEAIVFEKMKQHYATDKTVAPGVLRLMFHDAFVRGADASILLNGTNSEQNAVINAGLHGFDAIDAAKAAVEAVCPGVVSFADILAFASRDSVVLAGGRRWEVPSGRRDGTVSNISEPPLNLPTPTMNASQQIAVFKRKGLNAAQMTTLSGAHTIGISHCINIDDRLFTYPSKNHIDPVIPKAFLKSLQKQCPTNTTFLNPLNLDLRTPNKFDTDYFLDIVNKEGLQTSDQALLNDARTRPYVYANLNPGFFLDEFGKAMVAMANIGVLTGKEGQIRKHCALVNP